MAALKSLLDCPVADLDDVDVHTVMQEIPVADFQKCGPSLVPLMLRKMQTARNMALYRAMSLLANVLHTTVVLQDKAVAQLLSAPSSKLEADTLIHTLAYYASTTEGAIASSSVASVQQQAQHQWWWPVSRAWVFDPLLLLLEVTKSLATSENMKHVFGIDMLQTLVVVIQRDSTAADSPSSSSSSIVHAGAAVVERWVALRRCRAAAAASIALLRGSKSNKEAAVAADLPSRYAALLLSSGDCLVQLQCLELLLRLQGIPPAGSATTSSSSSTSLSSVSIASDGVARGGSFSPLAAGAAEEALNIVRGSRESVGLQAMRRAVDVVNGKRAGEAIVNVDAVRVEGRLAHPHSDRGVQPSRELSGPTVVHFNRVALLFFASDKDVDPVTIPYVSVRSLRLTKDHRAIVALHPLVPEALDALLGSRCEGLISAAGFVTEASSDFRPEWSLELTIHLTSSSVQLLRGTNVQHWIADGRYPSQIQPAQPQAPPTSTSASSHAPPRTAAREVSAEVPVGAAASPASKKRSRSAAVVGNKDDRRSLRGPPNRGGDDQIGGGLGAETLLKNAERTHQHIEQQQRVELEQRIERKEQRAEAALQKIHAILRDFEAAERRARDGRERWAWEQLGQLKQCAADFRALLQQSLDLVNGEVGDLYTLHEGVAREIDELSSEIQRSLASVKASEFELLKEYKRVVDHSLDDIQVQFERRIREDNSVSSWMKRMAQRES